MNYHLLPFTFSRISGHEVLVNELGDMIVSPNGTVEKLVHRLPMNEELFKSLAANFFMSESQIPALSDVYAMRLREKKHFLDQFTSLHIFVLTLRCNQNCVYCQASSCNEDCATVTMTKDTMKRSVELMFKSPSPHLTMEFQGGEPSLEPVLLRYGIELAEEINKTEQREIKYVLCTNCVRLTDEVMKICKQYKVLISTSLDGPVFLHNTNRGKKDSHQKVVAGIKEARAYLGDDQVSALMTTSELALDYPCEIIDEYVRLGFTSVFIRALNPYGLATDNPDWERYTDRFIEFYKKAFEHILDLNKNGTFFIEEYAAIILKKMITPFTAGFVDLQSPAGIINSVLVYNYDGYVYASDESRMLAEFNDYTFRLGNVNEPYENIVYGKVAKRAAQHWSNEAIAGCADCGVRAYCGADPVRNYSTQNDMYGYRPTSLLCRKNKAIIEYIISLMIERYDEVMPIFKSWLL